MKRIHNKQHYTITYAGLVKIILLKKIIIIIHKILIYNLNKTKLYF